MNNIKTTIYNKAVSSSTFATAIGGRFYDTIVPQDVTKPYAVLHMPNHLMNDFTFGADWVFDDVYFQINIYSDSNSASESGTILNACRLLFDWVTLSITGYTWFLTKWNFTVPPEWFPEDRQWQTVVEYQLLLQE